MIDLDTKVYLIYNTGRLDYYFYSKEERDKKWDELIERESHYQCLRTHYYYTRETKTLGQFICEDKCMEKNYALNNCEGGCENLGLNQEEYYHYLISKNCTRCPLKCHSTSWKADQERINAENKKKLARIPKLEAEIHNLKHEICMTCGAFFDKEKAETKCSRCKWKNYELKV